MNWLEHLSHFWPHLAAGFDFLAALLASGHALLHKRDSRAATLWLGCIWLLPLFGPIAYLVLGVNRIRRRAVALGVHKTLSRPVPENLGEPEHDGAEHLKMLARVVSRVVAQPLSAGNKIEPLVNGDEAFPAMLAAIDSAQKSVSLCTYIFDNDAAGEQFVAALGRAVQRGVAVRVLVDAAGARYSWPPITHKLRQAKVPYEKFLPASVLTPWRVATINLRNHRKLLVVDGQTAFTGGMNIRQSNVLGNALNFDASFPLTPALTPRERETRSQPHGQSEPDFCSSDSRDTENVQPRSPLPKGEGQGEGKSRSQTERLFRTRRDSAIAKHLVQDLHFRIAGPVVASLQEAFANDWAFSTGEVLDGEIWFPEIQEAGGVIARVITDGPDGDFKKARLTLLAALAEAQTSVKILTPYFLPDTALIAALNLAALRGVRVDILLPEKNNLPLVHWASRAMWWQVLERGCHLWLTPPPFDHSKLMIVDGHWVLLGSANWDARSLRLNFELNVEGYGREFAQAMEMIFAAKIFTAREVTLAEADGRSLPVKLRDAAARLFAPYL